MLPQTSVSWPILTAAPVVPGTGAENAGNNGAGTALGRPVAEHRRPRQLRDNLRYRATSRAMAGCYLRERRRGGAARFPVIRQLQARGRIAGAISEQRLAVGGSLRAAARPPGGRAGLERGLDGGGHELRGFRVDGDVPAEQDAADDLPGVPGCVLRVGGHVSPPC